jgi:hypothetical protein
MNQASTCDRCGKSAYAALKIEVTIGGTQLTVHRDGGAIALCALCVLELRNFFSLEPRNQADEGRSANLRRIAAGSQHVGR